MSESNLSRAKTNIKERNIGEKNCKDYLRKETDQAPSIIETLLRDWLDASLASDATSNLHDDDANHVSGMGIFKGFAGVTDLSIGERWVSVEARG